MANTPKPNPLVFEFEGLGSITADPTEAKSGNWFFQGESQSEGKRALYDLGSEDPMTVLNSLPAVKVGEVVLSAKAPAHLSAPRKRKDKSIIEGTGNNPTITQSGSIVVAGKGYTLMATITFVAGNEKKPASGYAFSCKAIPQAEGRSRPARGSVTGFTVASA
jgi:hypothetical protein